jgi:hypothetical protein
LITSVSRGARHARGHDLKAGLAFEHPLKPHANGWMIIDQQQAKILWR